MWGYASGMVTGLGYLNECNETGQFKLNDEQYERCLKKVQEYVENNKGREARKYERGAGVRTRDDRVGGGRYGSEREQYNEQGGGRVFRW